MNIELKFKTFYYFLLFWIIMSVELSQGAKLCFGRSVSTEAKPWSVKKLKI